MRHLKTTQTIKHCQQEKIQYPEQYKIANGNDCKV